MILRAGAQSLKMKSPKIETKDKQVMSLSFKEFLVPEAEIWYVLKKKWLGWSTIQFPTSCSEVELDKLLLMYFCWNNEMEVNLKMLYLFTTTSYCCIHLLIPCVKKCPESSRKIQPVCYGPCDGSSISMLPEKLYIVPKTDFLNMSPWKLVARPGI